MKKIIILIYIIQIVLIMYGIVFAQRLIPAKPIVHNVDLEFNGEHLKGFYALIDVRTDEEKKRHLDKQEIDNSVIVFFHGHAQRPDDAYKFTSQLALDSKSGIVVIPVCDTPFGKDPSLRGDNGKMIILGAIVRYALHFCNISVDDSIINNIPVKING